MPTDTLIMIPGALLSAAVLPGTFELAMLTLGGAMPPRKTVAGSGTAPIRFCIVIPAHDEAEGIEACLRGIQGAEVGLHTVTVVVVADNCGDDTAARAEAAGARVLVRDDPERRGKGYALDHAFSILLKEDHEVFVVVDADTRVEANFLTELAARFQAGADAVQARYCVSNPEQSIRARLMHVAWLAFNVLRPRGREYWGWSAGILGSGFGLHRRTLESVPFDAGSIAEDLEYHIRLVQAGKRVRFCDGTTVWSPVPATGAVASSQRARWEGGRFRMMREQIPPLVRQVAGGHWPLLEPLLDLLLLPLAFHMILLALLLAWPWGPGRILAASGMAVVGLHVAAALAVGRAGWRDWAALATAPFYIVWKLTLGKRMLSSASREAAWVRTERTKSDDSA
ncbi:glycosyltransferase family 2 protein [Methylococcus mesophilus]|uniref:glycosyltransferase family 2 protein n=1 Tax=Methylococcus mesophilus TaxID=2993564 RepID=UPI00224B01E4|nr:glycosyltransferase family 2 protein [Methylococcus mesophilus]UZR29401.1 glycosyltransferase family 2 protein [Methylococcus mesophilus]